MTLNSSSKAPQIITSCQQMHIAARQLQQSGRSVGVVPTMGALHAGHLSLVEASQQTCGATVVTIFVNPTQFAPEEDLVQYPRTLEADRAALADYDVDIVFTPTPADMYPDHYSTFVQPPNVADPLEGRSRPEHFRGVATVVLKLLNITAADDAFFGQKDYQQLQVIRAMVRDLNVPTTIHECPIVREPDGLAMSSRNRYLTAVEREQALSLARGIQAAAEMVDDGETSADKIREHVESILRDARVTDIDYVAVVDPQTLQSVGSIDGRAVCAIAARVGTTRLIDNGYLG